MAQNLAEFLSGAGRRGFVWGEHDCMLFAADWARELTGVDPAARWRGTYSDEAGAKAVLEAEGGPMAIMVKGLQPFGWRYRCEEGPGDIVLAVLPRHAAPVAAVVTNIGRLASLTRLGVAICPAVDARMLAVWRHLTWNLTPGNG